jgi:hypothetical protein
VAKQIIFTVDLVLCLSEVVLGASDSSGHTGSIVTASREAELKGFRRTLKFLKLLFIGSVYGAASHYVKLPNKPMYVYSLFDFSPKSVWIVYLFAVYESAVVLFTWIKIITVLLFLSMYVRRVNCCLDVLIICTLSRTPRNYHTYTLMNAYAVVCKAVNMFNERMKLIYFLLIVIYVEFFIFSTYACIRYIQVFPVRVSFKFIVNLVAAFWQTKVLFESMGRTLKVSSNFVHFLKRRRHLKYLKKELRSVRPAGFLAASFFYFNNTTFISFLSLVFVNLSSLLLIY